MDSKAHTSFNAEDRSYFAILKREIHNLITGAGFDIKKTGEADIVVAEMASNLLKHAGGGEILAAILSDDDGEQYVELISIDNGPGMADPAKMVQDGYSTSNTLGHGLGSIKRLSDFFEIYSLKDWGTIILSRIYKNERPISIAAKKADFRTIVVAKPGETLSGDGAFYKSSTGNVTVFLGDGLGHGPDAHQAVNCAISFLQSTDQTDPVDILRDVNKHCKKTRGLVGSIAVYSTADKKWRICGIGNIATRTQMQLAGKSYISYNGIIGMNIPNTMKEQVVQTERGQILIMCSDGIKTRWELHKYLGIFKYDLTILAAAIYKDFARKTDDMSVLVCRINVAP